MTGPNSKCCVCLHNRDVHQNVVSDSLLTKLQDVVPEEDWGEAYSMCEVCTTQLERAYEFRQVCIRSSLERKTALLPKPPELFNCYHCDCSFSDKDVLVEHIQTHTAARAEPPRAKRAAPTKKARIFSCEVCNAVMKQAKQVVEHCAAEHRMAPKAVKPYKCDECLMRFTSSANLIQHKKYHAGSRTNVCSICGKSYITKSDLTVHEYTHFNRRNYKCALCPKAFNTNKNLRSHMLVVHTEPRLWKHGCEVCGRRFPLKSGFEQHMRRHAGDKQFGCHVCQKSFVSRSELQKHMRYHSVVKPFKCDRCDKSYKDRRLLDVHLAKHHGVGDARVPVKERKYACEACPGRFCDKQKLERHRQVHGGVKPFVCLHCDKKYSDKYYLKHHLRTVHNLEDEDFDASLALLEKRR